MIKPRKKTYHPPSISLFQRRGEGFLGMAARNLDALRDNIGKIDAWLNAIDDGRWDVKTGYQTEKVGLLPLTLLETYALWLRTWYMIRCLEDMPEEDRKKHLALDRRHDFKEIEQGYVDCTAVLEVLETRQPAIYQAELNRQVKQRLDAWEEALKWALAKPKLRPEEDDDEDEAPRPAHERCVTWSDFFAFRYKLQWCLLAIFRVRDQTIRQKRDGVKRRLAGVNPHRMEERVYELDDLFEKVIRDRRDTSVFWLDDTFWWCKPATKKRNRAAG